MTRLILSALLLGLAALTMGVESCETASGCDICSEQCTADYADYCGLDTACIEQVRVIARAELCDSFACDNLCTESCTSNYYGVCTNDKTCPKGLCSRSALNSCAGAWRISLRADFCCDGEYCF